MTEQEQKAFEQMRNTLEYTLQALNNGNDMTFAKARIDAALTAANAVSESALVHVDWQDMYWKEKRRAEMWVAKYENDIGPLEKAYPQATEPACKQLLQVPEGYTLVPVIPAEEQWGGLARDMMMWLDMDGRKTAGSLFKHLERCGAEIPQWLRDEPEMKNLDHVPSKGTRVTIIYRAMLAAAPEAHHE